MLDVGRTQNHQNNVLKYKPPHPSSFIWEQYTLTTAKHDMKLHDLQDFSEREHSTLWKDLCVSLSSLRQTVKLPKAFDGNNFQLDTIMSDNFKQKLWRQFLWNKTEISDGKEAENPWCWLQNRY